MYVYVHVCVSDWVKEWKKYEQWFNTRSQTKEADLYCIYYTGNLRIAFNDARKSNSGVFFSQMEPLLLGLLILLILRPMCHSQTRTPRDSPMQTS